MEAATTATPTAPNTPTPPTGSRLARRRRWTVTAACCAALLSVGGVGAAQWVRSPAEAAARTRAPEPSVITAPVVRQVLRNTVVFRGSFSDGRTVAATPVTAAVTRRGASRPSALLVTGVFARPGRSVGAAKPLVEYDARPVFALPGAFPLYRDLTVGDEGKDVTQVQKALRSLGLTTGSDRAGTFGTGTAAAVRRLYARMGYAAPVTITGSKSVVQLPLSEAVFVPSLPARVVSVPVRVGDPVKGPVVTLARGDMTLTGFLDPSERGLVSAGMKADVLAEDTGAHATGTVESVGALVTPGDADAKSTAAQDDGAADAPAGAQSGGAYLPVRIAGAGTWDQRFADADVRVTLTSAATSGAVTAVPEAAVTAGADARTTVTVVSASGAERVVPVTAGVSADGLVQVTPLRDGTLRAGDRVAVGS